MTIAVDYSRWSCAHSTMNQHELGRLGGIAAAAKHTPEERQAAARARWRRIRARPCAACGRTLGHGKIRRGGGGFEHDRPACDQLDAYQSEPVPKSAA